MNAKETHHIVCEQELLAASPTLTAAGTSPTTDGPEGNPPVFDIKWGAGIFDGEGCIHMVRLCKTPTSLATYHLRVSMTQNDLAVLEHFKYGMDAGGHIYAVPRKPWHSRQVYTLNYSTADSILLLQRLGPHLVRKRVELALAQRFWTEGPAGVGRGSKRMPDEVRALRAWLYEEMKRVKRAPAEPGDCVMPSSGLSPARSATPDLKEEGR